MSTVILVTVIQRAGIMRWYFDDVLRHTGGSAALDKLGDPDAAAAMADTLYRHGRGAGGKLIQSAINEVDPSANLTLDGGVGPKTFDAFARLIGAEATRNQLMNALGERRLKYLQGKERDRVDHFR